MPEGERSEIGGGEEVLAAAVVVVVAAGFGVEVEIGSGGPEKERSGGGAKNPTWRILGSLTVREARRGSIRLGILVVFFLDGGQKRGFSFGWREKWYGLMRGNMKVFLEIYLKFSWKVLEFGL